MCDNQAAISIATEKVKQSRKHRTHDINRNWLQQEMVRRWIQIKYSRTTKMPKDDSTKILAMNWHKNFQNYHHMINVKHLIEISTK